MFQRLHAKPGRNHRAMYLVKVKTKKDAPLPDLSIFNYEDTAGIEKFGSEGPPPIRVDDLNLMVQYNTGLHRTTMYDITHAELNNDKPEQLIVRRGQQFNLVVNFDRPYNIETDFVTFTFQFGTHSRVSSGSRVTVMLHDGIKPKNWSVGIVEQKGTRTVISILTPASCMIGRCKISIESKITATGPRTGLYITPDPAERKLTLRYVHKEPVYILFNPWCKEDETYVEDEKLIDEYVLNDTGKVHFGNHKQISARPWNYGQFETFVLDCCLCLLEAAKVKHAGRGNALNVVHNICQLVCPYDDTGLLVGNWSSQYTDGTAPTQWTGSVGILAEYWEKRQPVKYGQCWVYAAVATTFCRALGIPSRCVTNFSSVHDCDGSNTINIHWNTLGEPIDEWNTDGVWSFHVWNEAYFNRFDLPGGHGGWQAFDTTPQEAMDGVHCAGPCSVNALKKGEVSLCHDGAMLFSDVYAHIFHWVLQRDGTWRTILQENATGRRIVTQMPRQLVLTPPPPADEWDWSTDDNSSAAAEQLVITDQYKFPEGSEDERAMYQRANTWSTHLGLYDKGEGDVVFTIKTRKQALVGESFDIAFHIQNTSRYERNLQLSITLVATYYTGLTKNLIKSQTTDIKICSLRSHEEVLRVSEEDYPYSTTDFQTFKIYTMARVTETDQLYANIEDFRLLFPKLQLKAFPIKDFVPFDYRELPPKLVIRVSKSFRCQFEFESPMIIYLTHCQWTIECLGMMPPIKFKQNDLEPYEKVCMKILLTPKRQGPTRIIATFHSKELTAITGSLDIMVHQAKIKR